MNKFVLLFFGVALSLTYSQELQSAPRKTSCYQTKPSKTSSKKTYRKKSTWEGLGKKSKVTGLPKTKPVNGHYKRTNKGYTYVNPYVKSK